MNKCHPVEMGQSNVTLLLNLFSLKHKSLFLEAMIPTSNPCFWEVEAEGSGVEGPSQSWRSASATQDKQDPWGSWGGEMAQWLSVIPSNPVVAHYHL